MCPRERLLIISKPTGLSFAVERIGPLAAIIITTFYLLALYLSATSKTPTNLPFSIYSYSFIETACQHLLLLVGLDNLISRKYYDTPPILVGHHRGSQKSLKVRVTQFTDLTQGEPKNSYKPYRLSCQFSHNWEALS